MLAPLMVASILWSPTLSNEITVGPPDWVPAGALPTPPSPSAVNSAC